MAEGLDRALAIPVRSGFFELQAGAAQGAGAYLRADLGYRPWENVAAYAFAEVSQLEPAMAGAGVKVTF